MADAVERASAIRILEDAVHLLRRAPLETWLCHSAGAVPFAMALLVFWNAVLNPRTSDARCALESLVLALLLLWMNCWRAVFAGRLRAQLSGTANPAWSARRIGSLAAAQSFLGPTRLAATLVAGLVMFPLAATAAFYRNAAVLSGYEDLALDGLIAKARRLAVSKPARAGACWRSSLCCTCWPRSTWRWFWRCCRNWSACSRAMNPRSAAAAYITWRIPCSPCWCSR
ncbi:MAG TPA: hypothetical protein VE959_34730 [Bryobacteraceae bacterium]|nr:hypothetical protein [Bryobacteraceae bacterium]